MALACVQPLISTYSFTNSKTHASTLYHLIENAVADIKVQTLKLIVTLHSTDFLFFFFCFLLVAFFHPSRVGRWRIFKIHMGRIWNKFTQLLDLFIILWDYNNISSFQLLINGLIYYTNFHTWFIRDFVGKKKNFILKRLYHNILDNVNIRRIDYTY